MALTYMKVLRKRMGLSQLELAEKTGVPVRVISTMDRGYMYWASYRKQDIARVLGCSVLDLEREATPEELEELHKMERLDRASGGIKGGRNLATARGSEYMSLIGEQGGKIHAQKMGAIEERTNSSSSRTYYGRSIRKVISLSKAKASRRARRRRSFTARRYRDFREY